jgi:hypothetical protein
MEECLEYFRLALTDPLSVPPWSEWWATHEESVRQAFPRFEYLRLKHRRLSGARQLLADAGEAIPYVQRAPWDIRSCAHCGERANHSGGPGGGLVTCSRCGLLCSYHCRPASTTWEGEAPGIPPDGPPFAP